MRTEHCHFDDRNVQELWAPVKNPDDFWGDPGSQNRQLLKALLEDSTLAWREGYEGCVMPGCHESTRTPPAAP